MLPPHSAEGLLEPLQPRLPPCTAQATPTLPIRTTPALTFCGNMPGTVTHCPQNRSQSNPAVLRGCPVPLWVLDLPARRWAGFWGGERGKC